MFKWRGYGYGFTSSVGHLRSDSVGLLAYDGIRKIYGASVLYYKALGTAPTLQKKKMIKGLDRPYKW
jgi:hypothetical protein